jgi:hypothetical protein
MDIEEEGSCTGGPGLESTPTYDLSTIQTLTASGHVRITLTALKGASELRMTGEDITNAVGMLRPHNFYKTMEAKKAAGKWQDVYRLPYRDFEIYLKVQIFGCAVIISFKER